MKIVVCDDDDVVRGVVRQLATDHGFEVIAETDHGFDAVELVRRFHPDVLVLDLSLEVGRGQDVLEQVRDEPCATVVFTAFAEDARGLRALGATEVVHKPDFELLERVMVGLAERATPKEDRRSETDRPLPPPSPRSPEGADAPSDFFATLGDARTGDAILHLRPAGADAGAITELCRVVRDIVRVQDRLITREGQVLVLLIGGKPEAPTSVAARVSAAWRAGGKGRELAARHVVLDDATAPSDAYFGLLEPA